jgi:hypothetical protein
VERLVRDGSWVALEEHQFDDLKDGKVEEKGGEIPI